MKFLQDNIKLIVAALFSLAVVIIIATALSVAFGGEVTRKPTVTAIEGSASLQREMKTYSIDKKSGFCSGDIITTAPDSSLKLNFDSGKSIIIEPETTLYIFFTPVSDKGEISVNLVNGSLICRIDKTLKKNESFTIKTPNTAVTAGSSVFRTEFSLHDDFLGYDGVMVTHVQNFGGEVSTQLYNADSEKIDNNMLLTERASAELVTASGICKYGYLNYDTDMYSVGEDILLKLIAVNSSGGKTAYTTQELDAVLKTVRKFSAQTAAPITEETVSETTAATTAATVPTEKTERVTETTAPELPEPDETALTTVTTMEDVLYTTYSGPKWWEMPNENGDSDDDFDDGGVFGTDTTAPAAD